MQKIFFFRRRHFFLIVYKRIDFDISCQLSPEAIGMKCQRLFSGNFKKNIMNLSSVEFAQRVVKVNTAHAYASA